MFDVSRMPGKFDVASLLKKSVQNIEKSEKSSAPTAEPSKADVKKVVQRKPKTAKKPNADKKATAPRKKVCLLDDTHLL